jgi:hypothetical protein
MNAFKFALFLVRVVFYVALICATLYGAAWIAAIALILLG